MASDAGLDSSVKGLESFIKGMEVVGDNLANMATKGHKGSKVLYTDSFSKVLQRSAPSSGSGGSNTPTIQVGSGMSIEGITRNYAQGSLDRTGTASHVAINGNGYFEVKNPLSDEAFATRNGAFRVDDNENIVTQNDGYGLQGSIFDPTEEPTYTVTEVGGELIYTKDTPPGTPVAATIGSLRINYGLTIGSGLTKSGVFTKTDPEIEAGSPRRSSYAFNSNGELQMTLSNGDSFSRGQILLLQFSDQQALVAEGRGLFSGFTAAGMQTFSASSSIPGSGGLGLIVGGALEDSNVDITSEFAVMIKTQKNVQALARMIATADRTLDEVVNLRR